MKTKKTVFNRKGLINETANGMALRSQILKNACLLIISGFL